MAGIHGAVVGDYAELLPIADVLSPVSSEEKVLGGKAKGVLLGKPSQDLTCGPASSVWPS